MQTNCLKKFIVLAVLSVFVLVMPLMSFAQSPIWAPDPLSALIQEGLSNNQSIKSIESQVEALHAMESVAGALQDPSIGIGLANLPVGSFSFDQEPMTQKQLSISQTFPWFGKLDLQSQKAALSTGQKEISLIAEKLALSENIAEAWYELGFVTKSQEINQRMIQMVQRMLRSAESRYATGFGLQQNIFQAQVELSKLEDEKITLKKKRRITEDRINELLNRQSFQSVRAPAGLEFPDIRLSVPALQKAAQANNPRLKAKELEILKEQTGIDLARKDYMPDFNVKLTYGQRDENKAGQNWDDFFSAAVMMDIPMWKSSRQDKNLAAAMASRQAAERSWQNLLESLNHQVDALATEIHDLQENYRLYRSALLRQADQWARAAKDAYEVGKVEFDTMINAQIQLLKFELQAEKYLFDIYKKRAKLESIVGVPLDGTNMTVSTGNNEIKNKHSVEGADNE